MGQTLENSSIHSSREKLKHMLPAFYLSCSEMLSKWEEITPLKALIEIDVWPHLQQMGICDVISRTAFLAVVTKKVERFLNFKRNKLSILSKLYAQSISQAGDFANKEELEE
ncbi:hypothetical protein HAX54_010598 [Datura stramonium]|uniref:Uncharacterized protein n=1 Tax=Datura stramonium TaxID=4076 RepID=A0ABS8THZ7_DATST|nr:hypothetical protein [Datura stramonium]